MTHRADKLVQELQALGQTHIVEKFSTASEEEQEALIQQVGALNKSYPGGLKAYVERGRQLLKDSKLGLNPYEGWTPSVPKGISLDFNNLKTVLHYEEIGQKEMKRTGFVLVAGGLGERLGYKGIKIEIPIDTATETKFLQFYISYILAFQKKLGDGGKLPLAIMTSDDTHTLTEELLKTNNYFGMDVQQVTIMKQEKVPAFINSDGHLALEHGKLVIETKPHGHGDVHTLLYSNELTEGWQNKYNTKWIVFFQDTNCLAFKPIVAAVGVSKELGLEMNTMSIKIKPGEAMGAITRFTNREGKQLVINVQYNQLGAMIKHLQGQTTDNDGHLVLPGNTNILILDLEKYHKVLEKTKGTISEFINPKYSDASMTDFKSSTRLECMMQDYPKLLDSCQNVGFTSVDRKFASAACKNDIKTGADKCKSGLPSESSSSCEASMYECNRALLRLCGAQIQDGPESEFSGIKNNLYPRIFLSPKFALTLKEMKTKVKKLKVSGHSTLVILSDCILDDVEVDGTLKIQKQGHITVKQTSQNYTKLIPTEGHQPAWQLIRGYKSAE